MASQGIAYRQGAAFEEPGIFIGLLHKRIMAVIEQIISPLRL